MEKVYLLISDYANKWRKYVAKDDYIKEFGPITDEEIRVHNAKVAENHEFLMDVVAKLNELLPGEIITKDSYQQNGDKLKMKIEFFVKQEGSEELIPFKISDEDKQMVEDIIDATEDFVEKDFISIF